MIVRKSSTSPAPDFRTAVGQVEAAFASVAPGIVDKDGDSYSANALRAAASVPVSDWAHSASIVGGRLPVGAAQVRTTGVEAVAEIRYFMGTDAGRAAFETVKALGVSEWSFTLDVHDWEPSQAGRLLKDVSVLEVSPVVQAAGVGTRTISAKDSAGLAEWLRFVRLGVPPVIDMRADVARERRRFAALR